MFQTVLGYFKKEKCFRLYWVISRKRKRCVSDCTGLFQEKERGVFQTVLGYFKKEKEVCFRLYWVISRKRKRCASDCTGLFQEKREVNKNSLELFVSPSWHIHGSRDHESHCGYSLKDVTWCF